MGKRTQPGSGCAGDMEAGARRQQHQPHHLQPVPPIPPEAAFVAWLVPAFVAGNVVAFAYTMYVNDCPGSSLASRGGQRCILQNSLGRFAFEPLLVNPLFGPTTETLDLLGALDYKKVALDGEAWRLFTCVWLHAGVVHLLANMLSFLFIGVRLEQEFGFAKIGTLYIISGFGGSLLSSLSIGSKISVGASGALFGLLGAMLSELITNWTIYANKFAALLTLLVIIAINLAVGIIPQVDSSAHIGGFLTGFLLGFILLIRPQFGWISREHIPPGYDMKLVRPKHKIYQYLLWFVALVLLIVGFLGGLSKLFNARAVVRPWASGRAE